MNKSSMFVEIKNADGSIDIKLKPKAERDAILAAEKKGGKKNA